MTTFTIAIVADASRRDMAFALSQRVGADILFMDQGGMFGPERNARRAWDWHAEHRADGHQWAIVLEDDAQPVDGFRDQLAAALTVAPAPIVSLYLGTGYPAPWQPGIRKAIQHAAGANWLMCSTLLHAVGVAVRADLLPLKIDSHMPIDNAISNWAKRHDHLVAYTLPSLVDHANTAPVIAQRFDRHERTEPRRAHAIGRRPLWTSRTAALGH